MFCFSCKYIPESPVEECVESIVNFHPNEKILIADSQSDDLSYFFKMRKYDNVEIFVENKSRSVGALWEAYKRYPNEPYYILIQDTVVLKKSLDEYINSQDLFITFIYFSETVGSGCLSNSSFSDLNFYNKILGNTQYQPPILGQEIFGSFGPIFIVKNKIMKNFENKGLIKTLTTSDKVEQQYAERIFGICAEQEGYPFNQCTIEGEYYNNLDDILNKKVKTFDKHFLMSNNARS